MRKLPAVSWFALLLLFFACQQPAGVYQQSAFLMGTLVEIQVVHQELEVAQEAVSAALARMQAIEAEMSRFRSDSSVSQINLAAGQRPVKISPELFKLLQRSREWGRLSQGNFDITIGALSRLWDFENQKQPESEVLSTALSLVDYRRLQLDPAKSSAYLSRKGMALDLGGIAKGYAVDEALRVLKEHGIKRALVDAGGDMRALGNKAPNQPWKVGLQHPRRFKEIIAGISLDNQAVVTSGDYERFFIKNGVRYHHILDPSNGRPVPGIISVTVVAPLAETADVLSTAVFVLGVKKGLELLAQQPNCEALLVTSKGKIITTPGFPAQSKLKKLDLTGE